MEPLGHRCPRRSRVSVHLRVLGTAAAALVLWASPGCQLVQQGTDIEPERPVRESDPPIQSGTRSAAAQATAAQLLGSARLAFNAGDNPRAAEDANRVVTEYPSTDGSSEALWILARATFSLGDYQVAQRAARRFTPLMRADDRRGADAALLGARAGFEQGAADEGIVDLLSTPIERARLIQSEATEELRAWVRDVETTRLGELIDGVPDDHPLLPPVWVEYGIGLHFSGQIDESGQIARQVLASEADSGDREVARSLLTGSVTEAVGGAVAMGLIVPTSGSPTLQQYAQDVEDGVRVALQMEAERRRRPVDVTLVDDGGDVTMSRRGVQRLEEERAIAIIGPLLDRALEEAALGRETRTVIVSPTASSIPVDSEGIYSLAAPDAGGVTALAQYASEQGYERLALIYPSTANSEWEAQSFVDAYQLTGRGQVERFPYEPGSTTFIDQLADAERFGVDLLVLPVPDSDVEQLAPQVTFSGLDTLGVHVLGNAGWGEEETLRRIDPRHTDGVVIASPRDPEAASSPYEDFVQAYEAFHRKTLRSPIPAFGYDAARLILTAVEAGARTPADLASRLERITNFPGATGEISIVDGRVTRRHYLYVIRDRELVPAGRRFE